MKTAQRIYNKLFGKKKKIYTQLFDKQIQRLEQLKYIDPLKYHATSLIAKIKSKKSEVISQAIKMEIPDGHIPFIPVIPKTRIRLECLMEMIQTPRMGRNGLKDRYVVNNMDVPYNIYFIFDIEDGHEMIGRSPESAGSLIKKQERSCLTVEECIALTIHTDVLSELYIDCSGSHYERTYTVPYLYIFDSRDYASLSSCGENRCLINSATPSCHCRM
jgi:hypothetical protein